jgi:hypothetical protein
MKRKVAVLVVALFVPVLIAAQSADAKPKDIKFLTDYMKQTKKDFLKSIKGVSEEQWKFKAAPDRWSIAEVAEHITLSEDFIGSSIKDKMMKGTATAEQKEKTKGKEDQVIQMITDRSKKAQAPEQLKPAGKFANAKEVEKLFSEKRDANIKWAKATGEPELRNHIAPGPIGDLDTYQWLLFMAAHSKRHTLQIEEVKADPNYPKK